MPKGSSNSANDNSGASNILSFVVRVWTEELSSQEPQTVWRGHITRIPDGKRHYFKNISELPDLLMPYLESQPSK